MQVAHLWEGPGEQRDSVGGKGPGRSWPVVTLAPSVLCLYLTANWGLEDSPPPGEGTEPGSKAGPLMPSFALKQWLAGRGPAQPANWMHQGVEGR